MRVLSALLGSALVVAAAAAATTLTASEAAGHPPNETAHGVNATTFRTLWAGDADDGSVNGSADVTAAGALADHTDIPTNTPPRAVERWNQGELEEFPRTDRNRSIHPPNATVRDGRFIKDAYAAIFAVQPSTRARLAPGDQPLYVAGNGSVLGTVDYRVALPAERSSRGRRTDWRLRSHRIVATRILVDGQVETRAAGSHTPTLAYTALADYPGQRHTISLVAEIAVTVERVGPPERRRCPAANNSTACRPSRDVNGQTRTETITVTDSVTVTEYDLGVSGFRARYPDGDLGLVVYRNRPWLGYSLPGGEVHGVWRFYAARDPAWDTLVTSTASGTERRHSPLHPLQVNAYPIETGPTATPRETVTILAAYGPETTPPTLPAAVNLDVLAEPYTASYGIATRTKANASGATPVTAYGLVRGVSVTAREERFVDVPINRSELALTLVNVTDETVTVRVRLTDAATGAPIDTSDRAGYVVLDGHRVNTSANGTATLTRPRSAGGVSARYEPGRWWANVPGYVGSSDVVYVRGTVLHVLAVLYRLLVPVSLFLLGVFIIDRFTGWRVWPPWRRL